MDPNFVFLPSAVAFSDAETKPAILEQLAARFASVYGVDRLQVLESLEEREALGSTGFGRGVAIPHARSTFVNRPIVALLRLQSPTDFGSADKLPVTLVFGLLSPFDAGASHLHALAAISRMVRDDEMYDALVTAECEEAIFSLMSNGADRAVA